MVVFQRKIIYMGYIPPGARQETLSDVPASHVKGLSVREVCVRGESQTLYGVTAARDGHGEPSSILLYFQGNAGNPLHRLPVFQSILLSSSTTTPSHTASHSSPQRRNSKHPRHSPEIVCISPRSYWKSTGSPSGPSQLSLTSDYLTALHYALDSYPSHIPITIYGHSLGATIAVCLLSSLSDERDPRYKRVQGLVLENPFSSIPKMVEALYPQKWVPYRYLTPFVLDRWDALAALDGTSPSVLRRLRLDALVLTSELDEVVPPEMGQKLYQRMRLGLDDAAFDQKFAVPAYASSRGRLEVIQGALHENSWTKAQWRKVMTGYTLDVEDAFGSRR